MEKYIFIGQQKNIFKILPFVFLITLSILMANATVNAGYKEPLRYSHRAPVTIDEDSFRLQILIYIPVKDGRLPTLVLNHGSTGSGMDPARFNQPVDLESYLERMGLPYLELRANHSNTADAKNSAAD
jgi:hypothetical protein